MTYLNLLVVLEEIEWPKHDTFLLIAHNFPGFEKPHDLGFSVVDFSQELKRTVIDGFYLAPVWNYPSFDAKPVYERVLTSAFSEMSFLRYLIKTEKRREPFLVQEKEGNRYGQVEYGSLQNVDFGLEEVSSEAFNTLLTSKSIIAAKFYEDT